MATHANPIHVSVVLSAGAMGVFFIVAHRVDNRFIQGVVGTYEVRRRFIVHVIFAQVFTRLVSANDRPRVLLRTGCVRVLLDLVAGEHSGLLFVLVPSRGDEEQREPKYAPRRSAALFLSPSRARSHRLTVLPSSVNVAQDSHHIPVKSNTRDRRATISKCYFAHLHRGYYSAFHDDDDDDDYTLHLLTT